MRGSLDVREIEDVGETALSYSEVKALATGDPRILEKARVDAELTRLERLERSHTRNQRTLAGTIDKADKARPQLEDARQQLESAIDRRIDTAGDRFVMTVNGTRWNARTDAAIALRDALVAIRPASEHGYDRPVHIASVAGFDVIATARRYLEPHFTLELADVPRSNVSVHFDELRADRPLGIVIKLENRAADLERARATLIDEAAALDREADRARDEYGQPFARLDALHAARARSTALATELAEQHTHRDPAPAPAAESSTPPEPPLRSEAPAHARTSAVTAALHQVGPQPSVAPSAASGRDWVTKPPRSPDEHAQMAKDSAADSFAARTPIQQMDRPSVERELRHVHADTTHYTTAHAARDALADARTATQLAAPIIDENPTAVTEPAAASTETVHSDQPLERTPPGGWTAADRVTPPQPQDSSSYLSAQRHPQDTTGLDRECLES